MQTDRLTKSLLLVRPMGKKRTDLRDRSSAFSMGFSPGMTGRNETRGFRMANGNKRISVYRFPVPKDLNLPAMAKDMLRLQSMTGTEHTTLIAARKPKICTERSA